MLSGDVATAGPAEADDAHGRVLFKRERRQVFLNAFPYQLGLGHAALSGQERKGRVLPGLDVHLQGFFLQSFHDAILYQQ